MGTLNDDSDAAGSDHLPFSGPLIHNKQPPAICKSARFSINPDTVGGEERSQEEEAAMLEITLDIRADDDSIAIHNIAPAENNSNEEEGPQKSLLVKKTLEHLASSNILQTTSFTIKQVSQELRRLTSLTRRPSSSATPQRRLDRTKSAAARALKGLKFISRTDGSDAGWPAVEKHFDELAVDGFLPRSAFGQCIGRENRRRARGKRRADFGRRRRRKKESTGTGEERVTGKMAT